MGERRSWLLGEELAKQRDRFLRPALVKELARAIVRVADGDEALGVVTFGVIRLTIRRFRRDDVAECCEPLESVRIDGG